MNIKIDKQLHEYLLGMSIGGYEFGAGMRGQTTSESDVDILKFIPEFIELNRSPVNTTHFLQYKDEELGVDYVYCTVSQFCHALVNGDATICHEIFRDAVLKGKPLMDIELMFAPEDFDTMKIARAYLGLARRDLKNTKVLKGRPRDKKFEHAERSINEVRRMMNVGQTDHEWSTYTPATQHIVRDWMLREVAELRDNLCMMPHTVSTDTYGKLRFMSRHLRPERGEQPMVDLMMDHFFDAHRGTL